jgi:hypothetical protein
MLIHAHSCSFVLIHAHGRSSSDLGRVLVLNGLPARMEAQTSCTVPPPPPPPMNPPPVPPSPPPPPLPPALAPGVATPVMTVRLDGGASHGVFTV